MFAKSGAVLISRVIVAYGNGQTHYEQREIRLDRGDFTRDINRTPEGRLPTSLTLDYRLDGGTERVTVEIWSVLAPADAGPRLSQPPRGLDRILTKKDLLHYVPFTPQHIHRLEKAGQFPKRLQLGPNRVGWLEREIQAWVDEKSSGRD